MSTRLNFGDFKSADGVQTSVSLAQSGDSPYGVWVCGHWYNEADAEQIALAIHRACAFAYCNPVGSKRGDK